MICFALTNTNYADAARIVVPQGLEAWGLQGFGPVLKRAPEKVPDRCDRGVNRVPGRVPLVSSKVPDKVRVVQISFLAVFTRSSSTEGSTPTTLQLVDSAVNISNAAWWSRTYCRSVCSLNVCTFPKYPRKLNMNWLSTAILTSFDFCCKPLRHLLLTMTWIMNTLLEFSLMTRWRTPTLPLGQK